MPATEQHLIDAKPLVAALKRTDDRAKRIVFFLLEHYFDNGPFEFDAARIAELMSTEDTLDRLNPEKIAALQGELEGFFEPTGEGWVPRRGVLALN
jgi:hypothetical protein